MIPFGVWKDHGRDIQPCQVMSPKPGLLCVALHGPWTWWADVSAYNTQNNIKHGPLGTTEMNVAGGAGRQWSQDNPAGGAFTQLAGHNITAGCWHLPPGQVVGMSWPFNLLGF